MGCSMTGKNSENAAQVHEERGDLTRESGCIKIIKSLYTYLIIFGIGTIIYILNDIVSTHFPPPEISIESLLLPTVLSVTFNLAFIAYVTDKMHKYHIEIHKIGFVVAILFTASLLFLCLDISPIPKPTTRWIWAWVIFFMLGWLGQLLLFKCCLDDMKTMIEVKDMNQ